jgi:hypothetical protein
MPINFFRPCQLGTKPLGKRLLSPARLHCYNEFVVRSAPSAANKGSRRSTIFLLPFAVPFALFLLSTETLNAATVKVISSGTGAPMTVELQGEIKRGDAAKVSKKLAGKAFGIFYLNSDGGETFEALQIGRELRHLGYTTVVRANKRCASACGLIWLAGRPRVLEKNARVGFHATYLRKGKHLQESGFGNALVGSYLNDMHLTDGAIYYLTVTPPQKVTWLSQSDAKKWAIDFERVDKFEPPKAKQSSDAASLLAKLASAQPTSQTKQTEPANKKKIGDRLVAGSPNESQPANEISATDNSASKKMIADRLSADSDRISESELPTGVRCKLTLDRIVGEVEDKAAHPDLLCREKLLYDLSSAPSKSSLEFEQPKTDLYVR